MATPLTAAHRRWRIKVFVATWLSYVGFYFCRRHYSAAKYGLQHELHWDTSTIANVWAAYLIAYSIGQFLASQMNTLLGPRRNLLLGMGCSVAVSFGVGITSNAWMMGGMLAVNGVAQATGWSGNVGTMANWFHKHERGRVMGVWSTNFTVGSLVSAAAMGMVLGLQDPEPWRWCFFAGAMVLTLVGVQFYFLQRNKPEDVGLPPVDDPATSEDESRIVEPEDANLPRAVVVDGSLPRPRLIGGLSRAAWTNLFLVAGFYFCAKFVRYAVWSWAVYFMQANFHLSGSRANFYATTFELCGLPGVYLTGWISDRYFKSRRSEVATIMMFGMVIATGLLVLYGGTSVTVFAVLLGAVGFTLYGPDALLSGAGAMDIGGRHRAAFATAVISGFGSMGPVLQEVVIGRMYDSKSGNLTPVFVMLFASAIVGTLFCIALVLRNRKGGKGI